MQRGNLVDSNLFERLEWDGPAYFAQCVIIIGKLPAGDNSVLQFEPHVLRAHVTECTECHKCDIGRIIRKPMSYNELDLEMWSNVIQNIAARILL